MLYLLAIPPLAPVLVTKGIECSMASSKHPNAETDRARIFDTVDRTSLERGVRAGLVDRCGRDYGDLSTRRRPAAVIRIERVEYGIRDSQEEQAHVISGVWQATAAPGSRILRDAVTSCVHAFTVDAGAWAVDADQARAEIDQARVRAAQPIALEFLAADNLFACRYPTAERNGRLSR
jgi:hypothetical protein